MREHVDERIWLDALLADMRHEAALLPERQIGSIFFGGGTPSLMSSASVAALIDEAAHQWSLTQDCEITLEANPNSVEVAAFADLAAAGVNRVSIGVQSFDSSALAFLGRGHDASEARHSIALAQRFFARVSFDLIYARPEQTLAAWEAELGEALAFGTEHLSLYQLTIEAGTRFATLAARGELALPDGDAAADLFEATRAQMTAAGLSAYEVSNHARVGQESRHNLTYWRYGDYVGVGPGAHGRRGGCATERHRKPENWLSAVALSGHGLKIEQLLPARERAAEAMLMGLRLAEGVDLMRIEAHSGLERNCFVNGEALRRLEQDGLLHCDCDRLVISERGILLLDSILPQLVR